MQRFNYRVTLAYRGDCFAGFARQPGLDTVEGALLEAIVPIAPDVKGLSVGGRTDKGVHALGQVVSFWSKAPCDPRAIEAAIDSARPGAMAALEVRSVTRPFHAQHSASMRRYAYFLETSVDAHPLDRMLFALVGRRCFNAFARDTPKGQPTVRTLFEASARRIDDATVRIDLAGDGFLRRQVRVMVATAKSEVLGGAGEDALVKLAEQGDRALTAIPAAPEGLYLVRVGYHALMAISRTGKVLRD